MKVVQLTCNHQALVRFRQEAPEQNKTKQNKNKFPREIYKKL